MLRSSVCVFACTWWRTPPLKTHVAQLAQTHIPLIHNTIARRLKHIRHLQHHFEVHFEWKFTRWKLIALLSGPPADWGDPDPSKSIRLTSIYIYMSFASVCDVWERTWGEVKRWCRQVWGPTIVNQTPTSSSTLLFTCPTHFVFASIMFYTQNNIN